MDFIFIYTIQYPRKQNFQCRTIHALWTVKAGICAVKLLRNPVYNQMMDTIGKYIVDVNFDGYKDVIILNSFCGVYSFSIFITSNSNLLSSTIDTFYSYNTTIIENDVHVIKNDVHVSVN
jgi:hypothetical protein